MGQGNPEKSTGPPRPASASNKFMITAMETSSFSSLEFGDDGKPDGGRKIPPLDRIALPPGPLAPSRADALVVGLLLLLDVPNDRPDRRLLVDPLPTESSPLRPPLLPFPPVPYPLLAVSPPLAVRVSRLSVLPPAVKDSSFARMKDGLLVGVLNDVSIPLLFSPLLLDNKFDKGLVVLLSLEQSSDR